MKNNKEINNYSSYKPILTNDYFRGNPLHIGNKPQLLLGDTIVEDVYRVKYQQQTPERHPCNPLMIPELPWETRCDFPTVLYDDEEKLFKMWYLSGGSYLDKSLPSWITNMAVGNCQSYMLYAESSDGIHWVKPMFDSIPFGPYKKNNIVFVGREVGMEPGKVIFNPDKNNRERRFLMVYNEGYGLRLAYSPDGRKWFDNTETGHLISVSMDCRISYIFDESRNMWQMITRPCMYAKNESLPGEPDWIGTHYRRRVCITESQDFIHWTTPRVVFHTDENNICTEANSMNLFAFGDHLMGFVDLFPSIHMKWGMHQWIFPYLVFGNTPFDLKILPSSIPIIGHLPENIEDETLIMLEGHPMILDEGKINFYARVSSYVTNKGSHSICVHLLSFKENRFAARTGGIYGGWLLTREFIFDGDGLEINCDVPGDDGEIAVEMLYGEGGMVRGGKTIEGYTLSDCDPIHTDCLHQNVTWHGLTDMSCFRGKPVYIRFHITNAKLYSFTVIKK